MGYPVRPLQAQGRMEDFVGHFVREPDGCWTCVEQTEWNLPTGRIQFVPGARFAPGTTFMGVDMARLLDEMHALHGPRPPDAHTDNPR